MNGGLINCSCGQKQYVETVNQTVSCINCGLPHTVYLMPEPEPKEGEEDGTDL